jgi:hypothetical protein
MEQHKIISGELIGWLCFVGFMTWLDWLGFFTMLIALFGVRASQVIYLGVALILLCGIVAVFRTKDYSRFLRALLALGLVWLLVLPFIPWRDEKVMISQSALLIPGMTKAQVQSIMSAYPGAHDRGNGGTSFCTEAEWKYARCEQHTTFVIVTMQDDRLVSVEIDWD